MKLRGRVFIGCTAVLALVLFLAPVGFSRVYDNLSEQPKPIMLEGMVTVQFADGVNLAGYNDGFGRASFGLSSLDQLLDRLDVSDAKRIWNQPGLEKLNKDDAFYKASRLFELHFPATTKVADMIAELEQNPAIKHAEPVWAVPVRGVPNDPDYLDQWHHHQSADHDIDSQEAWDTEAGNRRLILAMVDSGVNWEHLDLADAIWVNPGEDLDGDRVVMDPDDINGIDDDGNGVVDDLIGYDYFSGFAGSLTPMPGEDGGTPDIDPNDWNGHGTHCAGNVAAVTNNGRDVAGIAGGFGYTGRSEGGVRIMCLRAGCTATDSIGYLNTNNCGQAMLYACRNGAKAINCSWGSSSTSTMVLAMQACRDSGVTVAHAAGNDNNQTGDYLDNDPYTEVLSVSATTSGDVKSSFSNYGNWVDVSAPGSSILATYSDQYTPTTAYLSGTSMAAPMVCAEALLIRSVKEGLSKTQVDSLIINTTDNINSINPIYAGLLGSGRINVNNAIADLPYAAFSADEIDGNVPLTVNFTDLSPNKPNAPNFWDWHFGDAGGSNSQNPSHEYATPGVYTVSLYVSQGNALGFGEEHKQDYIWVQADTMLLGPVPNPTMGTIAEVPVWLHNSVPIKDIQLAFQITGPAGADLGGAYLTTAGLRTSYFDYVNFNAFDPGSRSYSILMRSSATGESHYLPADTGVVLILYVNVPPGAEGQVFIDTITTGGKNPKLETIYGSYWPVMGSQGCCVGIRGNVDGDLADACNVVDVTYLVSYLFSSGPAPECT